MQGWSVLSEDQQLDSARARRPHTVVPCDPSYDNDAVCPPRSPSIGRAVAAVNPPVLAPATPLPVKVVAHGTTAKPLTIAIVIITIVIIIASILVEPASVHQDVILAILVAIVGTVSVHSPAGASKAALVRLVPLFNAAF